MTDLTEVERTVLQRRLCGWSVDQIAAELQVSPDHVVGHQRRAVWKRGAESLTEALILAIRAGLISPDAA